jgi:hypothetical protein
MPIFRDRLASAFIALFYSNSNNWTRDFLYLSNPEYDAKSYRKIDIPRLKEDHIRIVIVSDTHELHNFLTPESIVDCDIFIHCGDILMINRFFSRDVSIGKLAEFGSWLKMIPAKRKILVAGNHDAILEKLSVDDIKSTLGCECDYLVNESFNYEGIDFWASPLSEGKSLNRAFQSSEFRKSAIAALPSSVDVLITHGHCPEIEQRVKHSIHIWGHAHNNYGIGFPGSTVRKEDAVSLSICAALVNKKYSLDKRPIVLDIPKNRKELNVPLFVKGQVKAENNFFSCIFGNKVNPTK